jgi:hypothetical protein
MPTQAEPTVFVAGSSEAGPVPYNFVRTNAGRMSGAGLYWARNGGISHVGCGILRVGPQPTLAGSWAGLAGSWPRVAGSWPRVAGSSESVARSLQFCKDKCRSDARCGAIFGAKEFHLAHGLQGFAGRTAANAGRIMGGAGRIMAKGGRIIGKRGPFLTILQGQVRVGCRVWGYIWEAMALFFYKLPRTSAGRMPGVDLYRVRRGGISHVGCRVLRAGRRQPALVGSWEGLAGSWPRVAGSWEHGLFFTSFRGQVRVGCRVWIYIGLEEVASRTWAAGLARQPTLAYIGLEEVASRTAANTGRIMGGAGRIMA